MFRCLVLIALAVPTAAQARRPKTPAVPTVPSIEEVVAGEGFTPTPSQSDIYKPGTVLVPNDRGGHDVVVESCVDSDYTVAIMSQSSIATTLAGGVSARLGMVRGSASAQIEKRLSFVDPEQRTIALGDLAPTDECAEKVGNAARFTDMSEAVLLHDVLVAIIKNTVCTKADASGGVIALGQAEAAGFAECVQESDGQVPLGYKAVPLANIIDGLGGTSSESQVSVSLGGGGADLGALASEASAAAQRREAAEAAAKKRLADAIASVQAAARRDYAAISKLVQAPTPEGLRALQAWLDRYEQASVSVDGVALAVPLPEVAKVKRARDAAAFPSEARIGRMATNYYDKTGEWAGTFRLDRVGDIRVDRGSDPRRFVAHVAYRYAPVKKGGKPGDDKRTFTFVHNNGRWQCAEMGGHDSGRL